jgi:hypothetical protein
MVSGLAPFGAAQNFDAQVGFIEVTQAMPNTSLTAGRSTFVRVEALLTNPPSDPVDLDGVLRVFVNGVEAANSPVYSDNGPFQASTNPNFNVSKWTLNFVYQPPASNSVVFTVELNPPGPNFVPESNTANNTKSTPVMNFQVRAVPEFAYVPIDYRPGGGSVPNLPPENLIEPGVGDNFIQGIYPVKDVYYHRVDAPSKLWTGDLEGPAGGSPLLNSLLADYQMLSPKPDFLYGWVPGSLSYNGQAFLNSPVSMGNTQQVRHQRTYAHEVGHNTGLDHTLWTIQERGVDTEHHLNITQGVSVIKIATLRNIMDAGELTDEAWVRDTHYEHFFTHPKFANPSPLSFPGPSIFVAGQWDRESRLLSIDHLFEVPDGNPTPALSRAQADFEISYYRGSDLAERRYVASATPFESCAGPSAEAPRYLGFHAVVPTSGAPFDRLVIAPRGRAEGQALILTRSAHAPEIAFIQPGLDGDVSAGRVVVSWTGFDADGDELEYYLRYTHDGFAFAPLASGITETEWSVDLSELPAFEEGRGYFELFASDGLNTAVAQSPTLTGSGAIFSQGSNPPWVHISTPDSGKNWPRGATVLLHAQGWDLEDRELSDSQMVWTSDLDGQIAIGRMTYVTDLSVGTHVLTVTGTDDDLMTASDTTTIVITARGLPGEASVPTFYCTAGTSASGCQALLAIAGTPSASAPSGFTVTAAPLEGVKDGLFYFGTNGAQANPWGNGTSFQCVIPPTMRTPTLNSGGTLFSCDGSANRDMNAYWSANPIKNPGAGAQVNLQFWYRDPQNTSNQTTSLSNAVEFLVEP